MNRWTDEDGIRQYLAIIAVVLSYPHSQGAVCLLMTVSPARRHRERSAPLIHHLVLFFTNQALIGSGLFLLSMGKRSRI